MPVMTRLPNLRAMIIALAILCSAPYSRAVADPLILDQPGFYDLTISTTGTYSIEAAGGSGGSATMGGAGGLGADVSDNFNLSAGETLLIAVGSAGASGTYAGGGGGGSFIIGPGNTPLLVAGGGGGGGNTVGASSLAPAIPTGGNGLEVQNGPASFSAEGAIGGGGGGLLNNGGAGIFPPLVMPGTSLPPTGDGAGGSSYIAGLAGGAGGIGAGVGGFGGGGGGGTISVTTSSTIAIDGSGGGGGGYTGGGGGGDDYLGGPCCYHNGGDGGASFDALSFSPQQLGLNAGDGSVTINSPQGNTVLGFPINFVVLELFGNSCPALPVGYTGCFDIINNSPYLITNFEVGNATAIADTTTRPNWGADIISTDPFFGGEPAFQYFDGSDPAANPLGFGSDNRFFFQAATLGSPFEITVEGRDGPLSCTGVTGGGCAITAPSTTTVSEPGSLSLLGFGLVMLILRRRAVNSVC